MTQEAHTLLLDALLRLEHARQPLTDRTTLPALLAQVADEMRTLSGAYAVRIAVVAAAFDPPLLLQVASGDAVGGLAAAPWGQRALRWGSLQLATVQIAPPPAPALEASLAMLLRVAAESLAELRAAEALVQETTIRLQHALALDLHDSVKTILPGIQLLAEGAARDIVTDPQRAIVRLSTIREAAQRGMEKLGFLIGELRGQPLIPDLQAALDRLLESCAQWAPDLHIHAQIALPPLSGEAAACVLGVVRNALLNVVQHAAARSVVITIISASAELVIRVCDDGVGLDPAAAIAAPGVGLESMIEQVAALRGQFSLMQAPDGGTCLEVRLPLAPEGVR